MLKRLIKVYIIIIIVLSLVLGYMIYNHVLDITEIELIDEYINETKTDVTTSNTKGKNIKTNNKAVKKSNYLMVLEIPKINLKKGIYEKNNKLNNVDSNVTILPSSDLPDKDKGSVILASHNGNTRVSFFKNLEKLDINDIVYIYYLGNKFIYQIYKYDIVDKVGKIQVKKDKSVSNIVLISCKNNTNDKQIVYIGKLINIKSY